jgi:hypothetical protein
VTKMRVVGSSLRPPASDYRLLATSYRCVLLQCHGVVLGLARLVNFASRANGRIGPMIELTHSRRPALSRPARWERSNPEGEAWKMKH